MPMRPTHAEAVARQVTPGEVFRYVVVMILDLRENGKRATMTAKIYKKKTRKVSYASLENSRRSM